MKRPKCVRVVDKNTVPTILAHLAKLSDSRLKVGVPDDVDTFVKMLVVVHEYGCRIKVTPKMRYWFVANFGVWLKKAEIVIPERSFMRSTWDDNEMWIGIQGRRLVEKIIFDHARADQALAALGAIISGLVHERLTHGDPAWPPLNPLTIRMRDKTTRPKTGAKMRAKKRRSDTPLNNTGQNIRANIRWWVEK